MEQPVEKPKKKLYQRWWMWVIYVIAFTIVIANFSGSSSSSAPVAVPQEAIKVTALKIVNDYKENGVAADSTYKGKIIEVTGTVKTIDKDILGTPYISLESYEYAIVDHVQCMFPRSSAAELATVAKGQKITLRGKVLTKTGNILVEDCSIVK